MNRNALYSFVGRRVACICCECWAIGFRFDAAGAVVLATEEHR